MSPASKILISLVFLLAPGLVLAYIFLSHSPIMEHAMEKERAAMVKTQLAGRGIGDQRVLRAMGHVPRHKFVPDYLEYKAYEDGPLSIGHGQTISQPYIVALMTELAQVGPEDTVFEVGTGSGYQAAVLGEIAREVYTVEYIEELGREAKERLAALGYKNVHVRIGDGYQGWPEHAPFNAILVTAGIDHIPQPLIDQLAPGGRMVIPVGADALMQELLVIEKNMDGSVQETKTIPVRFVPFLGPKKAVGE